MPDYYVTHGTVQFSSRPTPGGVAVEKVRIAPTDDYAIKHKDKQHKNQNYVVFICDPLSPNPPNHPKTKGFNVEVYFTFGRDPSLREILKKSAFERTRLEITIDDNHEIIEVTIPATP
jgi:hypothetical protein